MTINGVLISP